MLCPSEGKYTALGLPLPNSRTTIFGIPSCAPEKWEQRAQTALKEGLAALERARGESAALRNLANAARLFDDNPNLRQLRLFQILEKNHNNTIVFGSADGVFDMKQNKEGKA